MFMKTVRAKAFFGFVIDSGRRFYIIGVGFVVRNPAGRDGGFLRCIRQSFGVNSPLRRGTPGGRAFTRYLEKRYD